MDFPHPVRLPELEYEWGMDLRDLHDRPLVQDEHAMQFRGVAVDVTANNPERVRSRFKPPCAQRSRRRVARQIPIKAVSAFNVQFLEFSPTSSEKRPVKVKGYLFAVPHGDAVVLRGIQSFIIDVEFRAVDSQIAPRVVPSVSGFDPETDVSSGIERGGQFVQAFVPSMSGEDLSAVLASDRRLSVEWRGCQSPNYWRCIVDGAKIFEQQRVERIEFPVSNFEVQMRRTRASIAREPNGVSFLDDDILGVELVPDGILPLTLLNFLHDGIEDIVEPLEVSVYAHIAVWMLEIEHLSISGGRNSDGGDKPVLCGVHRITGAIICADVDTCMKMCPPELRE